jgi:hypothetical protein
LSQALRSSILSALSGVGQLMRRLTRLTNAFSKKVENLKAAVALHFAWYNFVRVHKTLKVTPAMEAGIAHHIWGLGELVAISQK